MKKLFALLNVVFISSGFGFGQTPGCTDPLAINYNASATQNDGSCQYPSSSTGTLFSQILDTSLSEISGIVQNNGHVYGICDQADNRVFEIDTLNGSILTQYSCGTLTNQNWEEIARDSIYFYLGDFGNNYNGNRTDLRIYRIEKSSLFAGNPQVDTIDFAYSTQTNFNPTGLNSTDYDCEAFVVTPDSIFLFTKQWLSNGSVVFALPNSPGYHSAIPVDSFPVQGLITGATRIEGAQAVVLCGYSNLLQPFLYLLYDFPGNRFFSGNKRKVGLNLPFHQIESISTTDGIRYHLANEFFTNQFLTVPQQYHVIELDSYLSGYLYPLSTGTPESTKYTPHLPFPNPTSGILRIDNDSQLIQRRYKIINQQGITADEGIFNGEIDMSSWTNGVYLLQFDRLPPYRIIRQ